MDEDTKQFIEQLHKSRTEEYVDFSKITLDKEDNEWFKKLKKAELKSTDLPIDTVKYFRTYNLIEEKENSTLVISKTGKRYAKYRSQKIRDLILLGTKDWIALAISFIALIVSIVK